jgi:hypothetical protein
MDGVELIVRDHGVSISKTGPEVIRFQIRVVREDGLPLSKQTENEFEEMRMPRMMGLPPKISGFTVTRLRSVSSITVSFYVRANILFVGTLSRLPLRRSVEIVTKTDRAVGWHVLPSVCRQASVDFVDDLPNGFAIHTCSFRASARGKSIKES